MSSYQVNETEAGTHYRLLQISQTKPMISEDECSELKSLNALLYFRYKAADMALQPVSPETKKELINSIEYYNEKIKQLLIL